MKIVWDEPKRLLNRAKRRLDFATLDADFFEAAIVEPARAGRLKAVGPHDGRLVAVIFRTLGTEAVSVISMRRASRNERKAYGQAQRERPH